MNTDGFKVQLFAEKNNARYYKSWRYCVAEGKQFEKTEKNLEGVIDLRLLAHDTADDVEKQASSIVSRFLSARVKDLDCSGERAVSEAPTPAKRQRVEDNERHGRAPAVADPSQIAI